MQTSSPTPDKAPDLSIAQLAAQTSLSEKTIRRRVADGTLSAYRVGPRLIRIRAESIARLESDIGWAGKRA